MRVGCDSPHRNKGTGCDTGKLEFELRLYERNRRDVFVPNPCHLPAYHHLLLLKFRSAIEPHGGGLPLAAGEEPASCLLKVGSRGEGC